MLLIRPAPYTDESIESYIMRLADANGYIKVSSFWSAIRRTLDKSSIKHFNIPDKLESLNPYLAKRSSSLRIKALHFISTLSNQEPLPLLELSIFRTANFYCDNAQSVIQNGRSLPRQFIRTKPLVCPDCLLEANYIRQIWSYSPYTCCHVHGGTPLIGVCSCGEVISTYTDKSIGICQHCNSPYSKLIKDQVNESDFIISTWLTGIKNNGLPNVNQSHKYGLVLWWLKLNEIDLSEFDPEAFIAFFVDWPSSIHKYLEQKWTHFNEYGTKSVHGARFKDVYTNLLFISAKLPSARFSENIVLPEIYHYFNDNIISQNNEFLNLRINSVEAAILLNTSTEQIAALVDLGELKSHIRIKSGGFLSLNQYAFELGDLYCLWQAGFQTEYSNLSLLTSRW